MAIKSEKLTILIVEDHILLRQSLRDCIEAYLTDSSIDEAKNGVFALPLTLKRNYDLIITDINMPEMNGFDFVAELAKNKVQSKILTVSMHFDAKDIKQMLAAKVDGYLTKNTSQEEFIKAIQIIMSGKNYFSQEVIRVISKLYKSNSNESVLSSISKREKEIMYLILKEYSNLEIAEELHISLRTVETHKYNIMQKVGAKNILGIYKFAVKNDLFPDLIT